MMIRNASARWAVGTLAVVAIALSVDSLRRTRNDFDAMHAPLRAIRGQLSAFDRSDYRAAYRFAASEIQAQFPLPAFHRMVEQGYPQIAHSRSVSFGTPDIQGDIVAVPVTVTGQDGVTVHVVYMMRHEREGWRVAGVQGGETPGRPSPPGNPAPEGAGSGLRRKREGAKMGEDAEERPGLTRRHEDTKRRKAMGKQKATRLSRSLPLRVFVTSCSRSFALSPIFVLSRFLPGSVRVSRGEG